MKNDEADQNKSSKYSSTYPFDRKNISETVGERLMNSITDLPDSVIIDAEWPEDEGESGQIKDISLERVTQEDKKGKYRYIRNPGMAFAISAVASLVIGLFAWWTIRKLGTERETRNVSNTEEIISMEDATEVDIADRVSEKNVETDHTEAVVDPQINSRTEQNSGEKSTEPITNEIVEQPSTENRIDPQPTENLTEVQTEPRHTEESTEPFTNPADDKESSENPSSESSEAEIKADGNSTEMYNKLIHYIDPTGKGEYPETYGGFYFEGEILHVLATTKETLAGYEEVLKEYGNVSYELVEYSLRKLEEKRDSINCEYKDQLKYLPAVISEKANRVIIVIRESEYDIVQELLKDPMVMIETF